MKISRRKTFSEGLVKIWRNDVKYRHVTSFFYIFPLYADLEIPDLLITSVEMMQLTIYLHHNTIFWREIFPEVLVKIRWHDVILWRHVYPAYLWGCSCTALSGGWCVRMRGTDLNIFWSKFLARDNDSHI